MKDKLMPFVKKLGKEIKDDRVTGLAAEQAYYYMLSIFPMIILLLSLLPYLSIDPEEAIGFMQTVMPGETANVFQENIVEIISKPNGGLLTFGIVGTIWSASNGMRAFIRAMNTAFDVEETRSFIKARLVSIGLTFGLILTLIIALMLPVFGDVIIDFLNSYLNIPEQIEILFRVLRWVIAISVMIVILAVLYKVAPNKHYPFKHVLPGAIFATVVWQLISLGFSFYLNHFANYSATYGSLGGVIILMLWLFLTGLALVLGGEINAIYHRSHSSSVSKEEDEALTV
ncbi:ribonuclease [Bacillus canaveralius]|uniref:Ribonuclease n=1 Tax=Bacillus canaveralius TaxID=1403243 RepID=A0A2N5GJB8_9BACI|nr:MULTISPECIES: YihY/virulence factor BrkB family protein [Bacillus]PLR81211.1 ribonuclease [Bacillus canaveralius]PLR86622.1 ribonuclease [Bacillus sp. V33-4]PLS00658.1 ribonuclease [Bacillus canaveralius]